MLKTHLNFASKKCLDWFSSELHRCSSSRSDGVLFHRDTVSQGVHNEPPHSGLLSFWNTILPELCSRWSATSCVHCLWYSIQCYETLLATQDRTGFGAHFTATLLCFNTTYFTIINQYVFVSQPKQEHYINYWLTRHPIYVNMITTCV